VAIFCEPKLGCKVLDEIAVMNHSQYRALELIERLLEACSRGDVEMIDGLIEQKEITTFPHQQRQLQTGAFTIAQVTAWTQGIITAEQKVMQEVAGFGFIECSNALNRSQWA
jgi:hypothetical protein